MEKIKFLLDQIEKAGEALKRENRQLKKEVALLAESLEQQKKQIDSGTIKRLEKEVAELKQQLSDFHFEESNYESRLTALNDSLNSTPMADDSSASSFSDSNQSLKNSQERNEIREMSSASAGMTEKGKEEKIDLDVGEEGIDSGENGEVPPVLPHANHSQIYREVPSKLESQSSTPSKMNSVSSVLSEQKNEKDKAIPPWEKWDNKKEDSFFEIEEDPFFPDEQKEDDDSFSENIKKF